MLANDIQVVVARARDRVKGPPLALTLTVTLEQHLHHQKRLVNLQQVLGACRVDTVLSQIEKVVVSVKRALLL